MRDHDRRGRGRRLSDPWQRPRAASGADRIFLVSGGSSNQPVELAARLARDRVTVVDIGKCSMGSVLI